MSPMASELKGPIYFDAMLCKRYRYWASVMIKPPDKQQKWTHTAQSHFRMVQNRVKSIFIF